MSNLHEVWFLGCLLVTIGVEASVAYGLLRFGRLGTNVNRHREMRDGLLCIAGINLITHPLAWSVCAMDWAPFGIIEVGVWAAEVVLLRGYLVTRWRDGIGIGTASNLTTTVMGVLVGHIVQ